MRNKLLRASGVEGSGLPTDVPWVLTTSGWVQFTIGSATGRNFAIAATALRLTGRPLSGTITHGVQKDYSGDDYAFLPGRTYDWVAESYPIANVTGPSQVIDHTCQLLTFTDKNNSQGEAVLDEVTNGPGVNSIFSRQVVLPAGTQSIAFKHYYRTSSIAVVGIDFRFSSLTLE